MLLKLDFKPLSAFKTFPEAFTLFGAICWGCKVLFGESKLKELLKAFEQCPPFLISSPVFYVNGELFFPKPALKNGWKGDIDKTAYSERKKLKKVRYIPESLFRKILDGRIRTNQELLEDEDFRKRFINTGGKGGGAAVAEHQETFVHTPINRITGTALQGQVINENIYFSPQFSVFIRVFSDEFVKMVESSLRFTQLGGNKSVGMGRTDICISNDEESYKWLKEYIDTPSDRFFSIAPTFPDEKFNLRESYYQPLVVMSAVDGYYESVEGPIWKKKLVYLSSGSNIKLKEKGDFFGSLKEALSYKGRTVYQYGFAFPVYARW